MKKIDEMDRSILLRSQSLGYKTAVLVLSIWVLFNSYRTIAKDAKFEIVPVLILCLIITIANFSSIKIKNNMVSGDDEYSEPNKCLEALSIVAALTAIIIFMGSWIILRK